MKIFLSILLSIFLVVFTIGFFYCIYANSTLGTIFCFIAVIVLIFILSNRKALIKLANMIHIDLK